MDSELTIIFELTPINNFKATLRLPQPIICNAIRFLSTDSLVLKINSGVSNNIYTVDEENNIKVDSEYGLLSNINPDQLTKLQGNQRFSDVAIELISPTPINNNNAYDITLLFFNI